MTISFFSARPLRVARNAQVSSAGDMSQFLAKSVSKQKEIVIFHRIVCIFGEIFMLRPLLGNWRSFQGFGHLNGFLSFYEWICGLESAGKG